MSRKETMLKAVQTVRDHGYTPFGIAQEMGVSSMDLDSWLEEFDETYYELVGEEKTNEQQN
jgi:hypothetical protein